MKRTDGLTLVEILVAMAILGIVLALVTNWQTQTLQLTTKTGVLAQQLADLNDLTGYVGDRVRSATQMRLTGLTVNAASAQNAGKCDSTTPCLAVLVPEQEVSGATITRRWLRLVFRVESRALWSNSDVDKVPDTWADTAANKVVIIREYRETCTVTISPPNDCVPFKSSFSGAVFSGMNTALVADNLTSVDQAGAVITPFVFKPSSSTSIPSNTLTLKIQSKKTVRGTTSFTPGDGPYTLDVQARNCLPDALTGYPKCLP